MQELQTRSYTDSLVQFQLLVGELHGKVDVNHPKPILHYPQWWTKFHPPTIEFRYLQIWANDTSVKSTLRCLVSSNKGIKNKVVHWWSLLSHFITIIESPKTCRCVTHFSRVSSKRSFRALSSMKLLDLVPKPALNFIVWEDTTSSTKLCLSLCNLVKVGPRFSFIYLLHHHIMRWDYLFLLREVWRMMKPYVAHKKGLCIFPWKG